MESTLAPVRLSAAQTLDTNVTRALVGNLVDLAYNKRLHLSALLLPRGPATNSF